MVFVLATSQLVQISVVAVVTAIIYLILGLIVLTPALLKEWTHVGTLESTLLGWTIPVPDSLIHMCLFLGALTFMYVSARAVGDGDYRSTFLDPLIDDLHTTLIARNRYRNATAAAAPGVGNVDADRPTVPSVDAPTSVINFTRMALHRSEEANRDEAANLSGKRYGEVLLVTPGEAGPQATVYNSLPAQRLSRRAVVRAGRAGDRRRKRCGRGAAQRPALLADEQHRKGTPGPADHEELRRDRHDPAGHRPAVVDEPRALHRQQVNRHTVFIFDAGEEVYELIDPTGQRWVMQTWSQVADPNLSRADLAKLADRLNLPDGWSYQPRVLTEDTAGGHHGAAPPRSPRTT